ncbi:MAG: NfeD family protein [Gammaproteobacteria bacterium]
MDLLSGLLLLGVIIGIIAIVARELFDERISGLSAVYSRESSNPIEKGLVGSVGKVIEVPTEGGATLRVKVGMEIWRARLRSDDDADLSVGSDVRVAAADGMILDVERT